MSIQDIHCQILTVEGAENVRDIGGYKNKSGNTVKYGRFFRAGSLHGLTTQGKDSLRQAGVDCIVDLRSTAETMQAPNVFAQDNVIHYVHVPMLDYIQSNIADNNFAAFPTSMTQMYIDLLEKDSHKFKYIFEIFSLPQYSTYVFHCTAGKDRTGLCAMLLLGLADVDNATILADYAYSQQLLVKLKEADLPQGLPAYLLHAKPEFLQGAIEHLDNKYGGITEYLSQIGIAKDTLEAVKQKLLGH